MSTTPTLPVFSLPVLREAFLTGLLQYLNACDDNKRRQDYIAWLRLRGEGWAPNEFYTFLCQTLLKTGKVTQEALDVLCKSPRLNTADLRYPGAGDSAYQFQERVMTMLQQLEHHGVLQPRWDNDQRIRLTEHGEAVVRGGMPSPEFPNEYIKWLEVHAPGITLDEAGAQDETVLVYIREAMQCLDAGCYFASVFMAGAAAEKALDVLFHLVWGWAGPTRRTRDEPDKAAPRLRYLEEVLYDQPGVPSARLKRLDKLKAHVKDNLPLDLLYLSETLRRRRNEVGHPALRASIEHAEARAHLEITLPTLLRKVYALVDAIREDQRTPVP